ncbi:MAG: hypothetical protein ONB12_03050, partial [candidate division KSB1 bacterium]|nr:hypothetical protein [candidate division KSB1 bacterium]
MSNKETAVWKTALTATALFVFSLTTSATAQNGIGYSGLPFLKISPAARQIAMGDAFTALTGDVNLMRYNVGALGGIKAPMLAANFNSWIG